MLIKYDLPDVPIGTPMSFGGMLVHNGKEMEISEEEETAFKLVTGVTLIQAARTTPQLQIIRKKVS